jgi:hypothetical protein
MLTKFKLKRKSKYKNRATQCDGFTFDSIVERDYYVHLKANQNAGSVKMFLRQVPLHIVCNDESVCKYVCDFQVFYSDGLVEFVDVKGIQTDIFKIKKKLVEAQYPIEIKLVRRGEF